ncbi:MAG: VanZ family protein [Fuerstiella sp.]
MSQSVPTASRHRTLQIIAASLLLGFVSWGLLAPNVSAMLRASVLSPLTLMNDILIHCSAYTLAATIGGLLFANGDTAKTRIVCLVLLMHGAETELLQAFIPQRTCSAMDLFANVTGVALGTVIALRISRNSLNQQRHV